MTLEIALDADEEWDSSRSWEKLARSAAEAAIAESAFPHLADIDRPVEISVTLTGDEQGPRAECPLARQGQADQRPLLPDGRRAGLEPRKRLPTAELLLGDIILARGVCEAEAADKGVSVEDHATHLLVHGTLHLLGYDHHDERDAADMEAREVRALARLGIADPYEVTA